MSELKCTCGADMKTVRLLDNPLCRKLMYGRLPQCKSKKKRMRKKMAKKVNVLKMLIEMMNITTPPSYECPKCHKKESFYSAIGSRLVCVEQLGPPAGLIHYMNLKYPKKD